MATTKRDLVIRLAASIGAAPALTKAVVQAFLEEVIQQLAHNNRLELRDFGVFEIRTTPARLAQDPRTLKKIRVPAKRRVVFKPGRRLKEQMNGRPNP